MAEVTRTHRQREVVTRFGGDEAVELAIYKEGDANTVHVSRSLTRRLDAVRDELPEGIDIAVGADQSRFIQASIDEVLSNAILGGVVAMLVLLLFLKDLRMTLIIGVSIPISVGGNVLPDVPHRHQSEHHVPRRSGARGRHASGLGHRRARGDRQTARSR